MGKYASHHLSRKPCLGAAKRVASLSTPALPSAIPLLSSSMTPPHLQTGLPGKSSELCSSISPEIPNKQRWVTIEEIPNEDMSCQPLARHPTILTTTKQVSASPSVSKPPHQHCYKGLFVEEFPITSAGAPISSERKSPPDLDAYMRACGPAANPDHFETMELLMTSGLSNANKDRHLKSKKYVGTTPWPNCNAMLSNVDKLAHGPKFQLSEIDIFDGQRSRPQFIVFWNILEVIKDFLSNSAFKTHMRYRPWRLYTSGSKTERVYSDMAASDWWWRELEKLVREGHLDATLIPLIIATDETTLSILCGGQKAYPVYVSFSNLDKEWRRKPGKHGMYLLGYLPVDAFEDISNNDECRHLKAELVHRSMEKMLSPLASASEQGVEMWCPNGHLRRIFPRVAAYTADWPEQNLQCCTSISKKRPE